PGEEGAVYGLESSIMSAARAIAPMLGAGLAGWFGLRSMFLASGFIFLALAMLPGRALPEPRTISRRAIREPSDQPAK
ncbi:MAG: multidrug efflux MFS transporter, partial [Chloroflexi bacterium]|nr:multidrug efflux MFS transporter [Chloroflexota bacterium]